MSTSAATTGRMKTVGPYQVTRLGRRRWRRQLPAAAPFLQWVARLANAHEAGLKVRCPQALAQVQAWGVPALIGDAVGYGPMPIAPLADLEADGGAAVVSILNHVLHANGGRIDTPALFAPQPGSADHACCPAAAGPSPGSRVASLLSPPVLAALSAARAADRALHPTGYGPQQDAGIAMDAALRHADDGPTSAAHRGVLRGYAAVLPSRPQRQELENLPQEMALVEAALELVRRWDGPAWRPKAVVDFGGGNGTLPWMAAHRLGASQGINVERFLSANNVGFATGEGGEHGEGGVPVGIPHTCCDAAALGHAGLHERPVRAIHRHCRTGPERWSPADLPYYRLIHRDITDTEWDRDVRLPPPSTLVITKHLCGVGVDHMLRLLERCDAWPRYLVISSCCHMKGCFGAYVHPSYLQQALCIAGPATFRTVSSRTSWLHQHDPADITTSSLTNTAATMADVLAWQTAIGKAVEALLDHGRVQWLREHGYVADVVEHVPSTITPRNRLILARRIDGFLPMHTTESK